MKNVYTNAVTGATPNPLITDPDAIDEDFAAGANRAIETAVELARELVGAHQGAAAIVVEGDWTTVRKYFSLSEKYSDWSDYAAPATGYGAHGWILRHPQPVRLTQAELEAHPEWRAFGRESARHPPMRGWLALPLTDAAGKVWGLFQLSDKLDGDFTARDEEVFAKLAALLSLTLETLWSERNLRKSGARR